MATTQNFRTAFNGFNREDVVHYIEYLNSKHSAEINQLNSELEYLREKTNQQPLDAMPETPEVDPVMEQQAARIRELFDQCKAQEQEIAKLQAEKEELTAQLASAAQQPAPVVVSRTNEELEAYRRAERTERVARERAEQVYHQVNGTLADATVKVDNAAALIGDLTDRVMAQLAQLQAAVTGSKDALKDAAATMYTIRPHTEE